VFKNTPFIFYSTIALQHSKAPTANSGIPVVAAPIAQVNAPAQITPQNLKNYLATLKWQNLYITRQTMQFFT
jgi:hypothetical protein